MNTTNNDQKPTDLARKPSPVTPELRARMKALAADGLGRNAIAREVGVDGGTVTKYAKLDGYSFDREQTALAVRARQLDLAEARQTLASSFLVRSQELLDAMDEPTKVGSFGGRDNVWNETLFDTPPIEQKQKLIQAAATAGRAATELTRADVAAVGTAAAVGMLGLVRDALGVAVETLEAQGGMPDPTITPEMKQGDT